METSEDDGLGVGERPPRARQKRQRTVAWPRQERPEYRRGLTGEARIKENLLVPRELITAIEQVRIQFSITRPAWLHDHGAMPGLAAFREALLRLGLKHINDPELYQMIPLDGRRKNAAPVAAAQAPPLPASTSEELPEITVPDPMLAFTVGRVKESVTMPSSLLILVDLAAATWAMTHPDWLFAHGTSPGKAGFREGLIRLGLKHVNDSELADLIPTDQRRRK